MYAWKVRHQFLNSDSTALFLSVAELDIFELEQPTSFGIGAAAAPELQLLLLLATPLALATPALIALPTTA